MVEQTALQIVAGSSAAALREALAPDWSKESRDSVYAAVRSALAQAIAEEATGITFARARLVSIYSHSQLTPQEISDARAYNAALMAAYRQIDARDYGQLLAFAESLSGERVAAA